MMISGFPLRIKRFFLSRNTVIALMGLVLLFVLVGALVPQSFSTPDQKFHGWKAAHPWLAPVAEALGLHQLYGTPWFVATLALALVSLSLSFVEQFQTAYRRTFGPVARPAGGGLRTDMSEEGIVRVLRLYGYLLASRDGLLRFVKHPWGYWGNSLLHLGIIVTIAAGLFVALTYKRASITLNEGQVHSPEAPWASEEKGLLAGKFVLPGAVRLDRVEAEFWEDGKVRMITSELSFGDGNERERGYSVSVSSKASHKGVAVYQGVEFGDTFYVDFIGPDGRTNSFWIQIKNPQGLRKAIAVENFTLPWVQGRLDAAYHIDAELKSMQSTNPRFFMRFKKFDEIVGPVNMTIGESARLGDYEVRLVKVVKWSSLVFVDMKGMPAVFLGFFIIVSGGFVSYFTPPREVIAEATSGGHFLYWKAARFKEFYAGEYGDITRALEVRDA